MTSPVEVRFLSGNEYKVAEAITILGAVGITVRPLSKKIEELQTADTKALVRDKLLRAFRTVGRPMFVEHTGLQLEHLNGFPGGLTESPIRDAVRPATLADSRCPRPAAPGLRPVVRAPPATDGRPPTPSDGHDRWPAPLPTLCLARRVTASLSVFALVYANGAGFTSPPHFFLL